MDYESARGIRSRLVKRAQAGDNQHTLKEGGGDNVTTYRANGTAKGTSAAYLAARLKKAGRDDLLAEKGADTGSGCRFGASIRLEAHEIGPSEVHTYQPQSRRRARLQDRQR